MFTVYILYSKTADRYYVGHTDNLVARIISHNSPVKQGEFTRKNGPWELVFSEPGFVTRSDAMRREKTIKAWKSRIMIKKLIADSVGRVPT